MAMERELFKLLGPHHLTNVDWWDPDHSRCIAASLVQGVYVQELDRQDRRIVPDAQAELWWSFFSFKLFYPLLDSVDGSIFGAVYIWNEKDAGGAFRPTGAPKIVVAFRGTIKKPKFMGRDLLMDLNILTNELHTSSRFQVAFEAVKTSVDEYGCANVWIAGHSLGAAMAMLAGRKMAEEEHHFLQAHLFNAPFVTTPVEWIKNETLKRGFRIACSLVTAGLAMTLQDNRARTESHASFSVLRWWVPCLYVHPKDVVSSGYVGYFANQKVMKQIGAAGVAKLAAENSIRGIVLSAFGKDSKAGHLIPCARLTVNLSQSPDFTIAHGIRQWWAADIRIQCTEYRLLPVQAPAAALTGQSKNALLLRPHI